MRLSHDGELRILAGNPWLFVKDFAVGFERPALSATLTAVHDSRGQAVAWGFATPEVDTIVRVLHFGTAAPSVSDLLLQRLDRAASLREALCLGSARSFRLANSEGDFLPGLVIERFDDIVWVESALGFWKLHEDLIKDFFIKRIPGCAVEFSWRQSKDTIKKIVFTENQSKFAIRLGEGQKTGHFCDQRENRKFFSTVFQGESLLDLFCYTGGFSLALANRVQRRLCVDRSQSALEMLKENFALNDLPAPEVLQAEVVDFLEARKSDLFDGVVCDPPKLIKRRAEKDAGMRMYFHLNALALDRVRSGGVLFTFSCSGAVTPDEFLGTVAAAARKKGRSMQVIDRLQAGSDHPALLALPETSYLKGLAIRVL